MIYLIAVATFCFTLLGGAFALRLRDRLHLILGFSAGAIIGVAFFDLLPESLELARGSYSVPFVTSLMAFGFVLYLLLDRVILHHGHGEGGGNAHAHRGTFGAGSLSFHSFLDGIGIGLSFQVSATVGIIVAVAVLAHDFSDGINTVNLILRSGGDRRRAFSWLLIDALAPVVGIASTLFFQIPAATLGLALALFCGFFLYIGASDLLPESHHAHPVRFTTFMTVLGMGVLYLVIRLVSL